MGCGASSAQAADVVEPVLQRRCSPTPSAPRRRAAEAVVIVEEFDNLSDDAGIVTEGTPPRAPSRAAGAEAGAEARAGARPEAVTSPRREVRGTAKHARLLAEEQPAPVGAAARCPRSMPPRRLPPLMKPQAQPSTLTSLADLPPLFTPAEASSASVEEAEEGEASLELVRAMQEANDQALAASLVVEDWSGDFSSELSQLSLSGDGLGALSAEARQLDADQLQLSRELDQLERFIQEDARSASCGQQQLASPNLPWLADASPRTLC